MTDVGAALKSLQVSQCCDHTTLPTKRPLLSRRLTDVRTVCAESCQTFSPAPQKLQVLSLRGLAVDMQQLPLSLEVGCTRVRGNQAQLGTSLAASAPTWHSRRHGR